MRQELERWFLFYFEPRERMRIPNPVKEVRHQKCDRDRYKQLLVEAVRQAGRRPIIRGLEYTADIVWAMDLARVASADPSFARLLEPLQDRIRTWGQTP